MNNQVPRAVGDNSLDAFDEIKNDGTLGKDCADTLWLVENYEDRTARELHQFGLEEGLFTTGDIGKVGKRLSDLKKEILIYSPYSRKCEISKRTAQVFRRYYGDKKSPQQNSTGRFPKYPPIEFPSLTEENTRYTLVYWNDGSIESIGSKGFASAGHDRGTIGLKIIYHGIESLNVWEMVYILKRIPKKIIREFLEGGFKRRSNR